MINVNSGLELIKNELNISSCLDQIEKVYKETIGGRQ